MDEVPLRLDSDLPFALDTEHGAAYAAYVRREFERKRFKDDGEKFMLVRNPVVFDDAPSLDLRLQPTRYSMTHYCHDKIATVDSLRARLLSDLLTGPLDVRFPHSLCLQLIVVTRDRKVLATKRSPKVAYDAGRWSVSLEEQLARRDIERGHVGAWAARALHEELGLGDDAYRPDRLRALSVFIEADLLNLSVCGHVEIDATAAELDSILRGHPRADYEFTEWTFIRLAPAELLREVFRPTRDYHRTSRYRLLLTHQKNFGTPGARDLREFLA